MQDYMTIDIGAFQLTSPTIRITDPCYDKGVWCTHVLNGAKQGAWKTKLLEVDDKDWGRRNAVLIAYHEEYPFPEDFRTMKKPAFFEFGVDSGRAGVFDETMYEPDTDCSETHHTLLPHGVFCDSGCGDGGYYGFYDVDDGGRVVAILLDFQMMDEIGL